MSTKIPAACFILASTIPALAEVAIERPGSRIFIERPWNIRYILEVDSARTMEIRREVAAEHNLKNIRENRQPAYFRVEHLFDRATIFKVADIHLPGDDYLAATVIVFDREGNVLTPNTGSKHLRGKFTQLHDIALATDDAGNDTPYFLANWFWGIPGDGATFSPAVCGSRDADRYIKGHDASRFSSLGNFGCREWTYQLYDHGRPYIDVTSYEKRETYVKRFVGWSRFTDPPKPVIGKHRKLWLCLHDCPGGGAPGTIPDIAAWTKKHGFPLPQRPEKQPMFPDADYPYDPDE